MKGGNIPHDGLADVAVLVPGCRWNVGVDDVKPHIVGEGQLDVDEVTP